MQLDYNEQQAVTKFHSLIKEKFNVTKLILFGSRARGDADPYSDIDLLALSKKKENLQDFLKLSDIAADVNIDYGVAISCLYDNDDDWREGRVNNPMFKINVDREGIALELQ